MSRKEVTEEILITRNRSRARSVHEETHEEDDEEEVEVDANVGRARSRARSVSRARSAAGAQSVHSPDRASGGSRDGASRGGHTQKRIIVCCDGTWLDADSGLQQGKLVPPSNVTRLGRAIRTESSDGIQQIVFYQNGIGSTGSFAAKAVGGATGSGLPENVREAYNFISNNYGDGDEIFLIGFSRGAFTARSVGGLIASIGVLTKDGMWAFPVVYKDFTHRHDRDYRSPYRDVPYPNKPTFRNPEYVREMERRGMTRLNVHIKAIGVFDTVGSLGVPKVTWAGRLSQQITNDMHEYAFYDTTLSPIVDNAFQALALDEKRGSFQPCLWERTRDNNDTNLIQVWFPGVHANIGGGYDDQELSNITLAWMMSMLAPLLDFNLDYLVKQEKENAAYYREKGEDPRPWSLGKIYNSASGGFALGGTMTRTPGDYTRTDPITGEPTRKPLRNTNEYIHCSVRSRFVLNGPGYGDRGNYEPRALRRYKLRSDPNIKGLPTPWFWEETGGSGAILPEAPLRKAEKMLLHTSPDMEEYIETPPRAPRRSRRD